MAPNSGPIHSRPEERKRRTRLVKTEAEIETLESETEELQSALSDEAVQSDYEKLIALTAQLEEKQARLEELYELWEELQDE